MPACPERRADVKCSIAHAKILTRDPRVNVRSRRAVNAGLLDPVVPLNRVDRVEHDIATILGRGV